MSAKWLSLSSKPLIAVVLLMVAAVVVFNVRTFGGARGARHAAQVRMQASPPYPIDIDEVVRSSSQTPLVAAPSSGVLADLARDPFAQAKSVEPVAATTTRRSRPSHRRKTKSLHCDAVFPGGQSPLALIQGKPCHIGDTVGGYTVRSIAPVGVKLVNGNGKELFLAVGTDNEGQGTSRVITNLHDGDYRGRTRLVEYEYSERKIP